MCRRSKLIHLALLTLRMAYWRRAVPPGQRLAEVRASPVLDSLACVSGSSVSRP